MASFTPYQPNISMVDVENWAESVAQDVDMTTIGFGSEAQHNEVGRLF
jgi:hypothetical protein